LFDLVAYAQYRAKDRVQRNEIALLPSGALFDRAVAATSFDHEVNRKGGLVVVDGGDVQVGVYDLNIGVTLDVLAGYSALALFDNAQGLRFVAVDAETQLLKRQHDANDVFLDALDGGEFVSSAVNLEAGYASTSDAGKQYTA